MKTKIWVETERNITRIEVRANVRYWEDSKYNGEYDDANNPLMPCVIKDAWCLIIDIDNGRILNWQEGVKANIHYKVCDEFYCKVMDDLLNVVKEYDGYVPSFMYPKENGCGDYIIMDIDENGYICDWDKNKVEKFMSEY